MGDLDRARRFALSLPGTTEEPHHEMSSFRVRGKIFATVPPDETRLHVFVDEAEIASSVAEDPGACEPLPWGKAVRGLRVLLAAAPAERVEDLLLEAWRRRAPKRVVADYDAARATLSYVTDPRVDAYVMALPGWQQDICRELRDLIHSADAEIAETIKRTNRPYFVLQGNVCALMAAKDHVNLFLYDGAIVADPDGIITAGHDNSTARTVAVRQGEAINAHALTAMLRAIVANNRAGGWRKLK